MWKVCTTSSCSTCITSECGLYRFNRPAIYPLTTHTPPPFKSATRSIRFISPSTLRPIPPSHLPTPLPSTTKSTTDESDVPPPGTVKSILPCTPLAIVKVLEYVGVYNKLLKYGDRARG